MSYQLNGRLLEICTCGAYCPCRVTGEPDGGACDAVNAWHIDQGTINGTDVSGLTLVALNKVHGHVLKGRPVVFYVDDKATSQQQEALLAVWTGKLGGPVADLAQLIGEVAGVELAPIVFTVRGNKGTLKVGQAIEAKLMAPSHAATGHAATPHDDLCTTVPGSQTTLGEAEMYRVNTPNYGFNLDLQNQQIIQGRFRFEG
jgi:hypothetical protein